MACFVCLPNLIRRCRKTTIGVNIPLCRNNGCASRQLIRSNFMVTECQKLPDDCNFLQLHSRIACSSRGFDFWLGCYQVVTTVLADRSMQVNEGRFMMNNRCGYVLQPDCMRHPSYDPCDKCSLNRVDPVVEPVHISIYVSSMHDYCSYTTVVLQGFHASWKVLEFFVLDFPELGKC